MSPERTIGESIRQAREARGLSPEDVSRETRLSLVVIRALEQDRFAEMAGGLYTENAIRILADYLKLDRAALISCYRDGQGGTAGSKRAEEGGVWSEQVVPEIRVQGWRPGSRFWLILIPVLLALVLGGMLLLGRLSLPGGGATRSGGVDSLALSSPGGALSSPAAEAARSLASEATQTVQVETEPSPTHWDDGPLLVTAAGRGTLLRREAALELSLRGLADCRVQVNVDGRRHLARALGPGQTWRILAGEYVVLSSSDASAFELSVDGVPYPLPALAPGEALGLRLESAAEGAGS